MTDSDFEKYYQKGGTYVLPIEVFNELFGEMENWKKECKQKENIIKEVREKTKENQEYLENAKEMYINQNNEILKTHTLQLINNSLVQNDKLLKILDKGKNNEEDK